MVVTSPVDGLIDANPDPTRDPRREDPTTAVGPPGPGVTPPSTGPLGCRPGALAPLLAARAALHPDVAFLRAARPPRPRGASRPVTFGALAEAVDQWDRWLEARDLGPGSRVGVATGDPLCTGSLLIALVATGRWAVLLDPDVPARAQRADMARLAPAVVVGRRRPDAVPSDVLPGAFVVTEGERDVPATGVGPGFPGHEGGSVLSSSGTTGTPKTIPLGEAQLMAAAHLVAGHLELGPDDVTFNPLPLFHVNAQVVAVLAGLVSGSGVVLDDRFHRTDCWDVLARTGATWINGVPAILSRLADLRPGERVPAGIRLARSASAPLPVAVLERFEATTGIPVVETYGMSEAASQITANPVDGPRRPGSVGRPVGVDLRIVPLDEDSPPTEGGLGHVEIRGASVRGPGGPGSRHWLRTGDLGRLDDDGYLYLAGRDDDLINRGGEMIAPRALEEILVAAPGVAQAVVVPEAHPSLGQVPVAFAVPAATTERSRSVPGSATDSARALATLLADLVTDSVPRDRRPAAVHVVASLPATATGKVRRARVSAEAPSPLASVVLP